LVEAWDTFERALAERPAEIRAALGDSEPTSFSALYLPAAVKYFSALVAGRCPCPPELAEGAGVEFLSFVGTGYVDVLERVRELPPEGGLNHRKVFRGSVFRHPDVAGVCVLWRWYSTESFPAP
jgi:hypothetical protein